MGRGIVKIKDRYFEWSTIVDAPVTCGLTLPELQAYVKEEYGRRGLEDLPERVARADATGSSFVDWATKEELLATNRAGDDETHLSEEEIYVKYTEKEDNP